MQSCDVLIVGGGPAGSSCAWGLRRSGLDVAILDKDAFPRDKICGGWITPGVLTELEIDPAEYGRQRVLQPIQSFRVGCIGGPSVETEYGRAVSYGIRRRQFDDYLLRRSGARVLPPAALANLERTQDGWIANGEIQSSLIVGAGGHFCPVARLTGAKAGAETPVVAQETEFEMNADQLANCKVRGDTPELYFCSDMKGYGWCFRKENFLNVGLGRADPHRLSAHVAEFLRFLISAGRISFDIPPLRGHAYLLQGYSTREIAGDRFLLIGDAAGLAYPQSGEGILPAIQSGLQAAKSIVAAHGRCAKQQTDAYRAAAAGRKQPWVTGVGRYLPSQCIGFIGRALLRTRWFTRGVVLNEWFLRLNSNAL
jgi:menaquinone-9 beta-reductase